MQLRVPPLGESITEATITRWLKRAGDAVNAGETLVELETDKITSEGTAEAAGKISFKAAAGDEVKIGQVVATMFMVAIRESYQSVTLHLRQPPRPDERYALEIELSREETVLDAHTMEFDLVFREPRVA